jgi:hypothetical protein
MPDNEDNFTKAELVALLRMMRYRPVMQQDYDSATSKLEALLGGEAAADQAISEYADALGLPA